MRHLGLVSPRRECDSQARASIALEFNGSRKRSQPPRLWSKIANRVDLAPSRGVAAFIQLRSATDRAPLMHCMADRALLSARSRRWRRSRIDFSWADFKFLVTSRQPASMNTRRACQGAPQSKQISPSDRLEKAAQVIINGLSFGGIPSPTMALPGTCDRQLLQRAPRPARSRDPPTAAWSASSRPKMILTMS